MASKRKGMAEAPAEADGDIVLTDAEDIVPPSLPKRAKVNQQTDSKAAAATSVTTGSGAAAAAGGAVNGEAAAGGGGASASASAAGAGVKPLDADAPVSSHDDKLESLPVIELNVGGQHFTTLLSTLRKYPDSMLAGMFGGAFPRLKDKEGRFFIDRDGSLFAYVLNWMRTGVLPVKEMRVVDGKTDCDREPNHLPKFKSIEWMDEVLLQRITDESKYYHLDALTKRLETIREQLPVTTTGVQAYIVADGASLGALLNKVNHWIAHGLQPFGSPQFLPQSGQWIQTMVK